jgi:hypothetical protein
MNPSLHEFANFRKTPNTHNLPSIQKAAAKLVESLSTIHRHPKTFLILEEQCEESRLSITVRVLVRNYGGKDALTSAFSKTRSTRTDSTSPSIHPLLPHQIRIRRFIARFPTTGDVNQRQWRQQGFSICMGRAVRFLSYCATTTTTTTTSSKNLKQNSAKS